MIAGDAATIAALDDPVDARLDRIAPGRAADLIVLERHEIDPWEAC